MQLILRDNIFILTLQGKIVFENSNDLKNQAKDLLKEKQASKIIIDLSEVTFLDSSGVGLLISLFKNTMIAEGRLTIAAPVDNRVKRVLELTCLEKIIDIYPTLEKALQSF